ncbi:nucleotidyltransferase [Aquibacillus sp. 3ASR75-11]|uniref:tRNA(Met) cytidine acetate ligase n=1 Tax=Terrihalobacillus insolitus TaxID=2950438 RepID=A0A9X3WPV3_9BACI|nr:nucleotidyltransferase [Terrihalobacillus insolitus]MDC3412816.1 nucleotidyltransferase [Terrihalobacillus insolitus]MDC3423707.1 nucleotidyltransferase [Terrihalobacillus insolitus]
MEACGLIVEYNPFHYGHQLHFSQSKQHSGKKCMIAVMSGNFLQRGEPAIIDKFHRTTIALQAGIDLVVELPFAYSVQNSDLFAKGAILTLKQLGASAICFGSEHGDIADFIHAYELYQGKQAHFKQELKKQLVTGLSFPESSKRAYQSIGLDQGNIDLTKPNNILGFSYVKNIFDYQANMEPLTIKRSKSGYHDPEITHRIASATSIRSELFTHHSITDKAANSLPLDAQRELQSYKKKTGFWHNWERYFPFLQYRVLTMTTEELHQINGMEEGLENRIKQTAEKATSFNDWMQSVKTKRYTWTRLQRLFTHILTNTKKVTLKPYINESRIPYIRLLGMSKTGQSYLNEQKKKIDVPMLTRIQHGIHPFLDLEERVSDAYYSVLPPLVRQDLKHQELQPPIRI